MKVKFENVGREALCFPPKYYTDAKVSNYKPCMIEINIKDLE